MTNTSQRATGDGPTHAKTCPECEEPTFEFERYCHRCNVDTWTHE